MKPTIITNHMSNWCNRHIQSVHGVSIGNIYIKNQVGIFYYQKLAASCVTIMYDDTMMEH